MIDHSKVHSIQNWVITISCIFLSISGVVLALVCIFSLPDKSTRPLLGSICFIASTLLLMTLLLFLRRNSERYQISQLAGATSVDSDAANAILREAVSDKVLKWVVTLFSVFFAYGGVPFGLICIYSLPDKTVQPAVGAVYFFCSTSLIATFIYVVWKKR